MGKLKQATPATVRWNIGEANATLPVPAGLQYRIGTTGAWQTSVGTVTVSYSNTDAQTVQIRVAPIGNAVPASDTRDITLAARPAMPNGRLNAARTSVSGVTRQMEFRVTLQGDAVMPWQATGGTSISAAQLTAVWASVEIRVAATNTVPAGQVQTLTRTIGLMAPISAPLPLAEELPTQVEEVPTAIEPEEAPEATEPEEVPEEIEYDDE